MEQGDSTTDSYLACDVHSGTHLDAPAHILPDGVATASLSLETLIGPAVVAEHGVPGHITADLLAGMKIGNDTRRLLLKTRNSTFWEKEEFQKDFIGLTADAAEWIVEQNIALVGIDYLSIEPYGQSLGTHTILLQAGVVILEGLDLSKVTPGTYEMICLPLKLADSEGAPARTVLRPISATGEML
jgi:arylformamidase